MAAILDFWLDHNIVKIKRGGLSRVLSGVVQKQAIFQHFKMDSLYAFHLLDFQLTIKARSFFESATIHRDQ